MEIAPGQYAEESQGTLAEIGSTGKPTPDDDGGWGPAGPIVLRLLVSTVTEKLTGPETFEIGAQHSAITPDIVSDSGVADKPVLGVQAVPPVCQVTPTATEMSTLPISINWPTILVALMQQKRKVTRTVTAMSTLRNSVHCQVTSVETIWSNWTTAT